jgi:hypothetical protein
MQISEIGGRGFASDGHGGWVFTDSFELEGWLVELEWKSGGTDEPGAETTHGPSTVKITAAASPVPTRGLTSGALRRIEAQITALTADFHSTSQRAEAEERAMQGIRDQIAAMPSGPRAGSDYYPRLLQIVDELERIGRMEPINDLVSVTGIPKETIKTRLRIARKLAKES